MSANLDVDSSNRDPILVDLGRKKRKDIKRLRDGEGRLMTEVQDTLDELKSNGSISENAQPIIIIVREKQSNKTLNPFFPY
jgi:hypothetical protein